MEKKDYREKYLTLRNEMSEGEVRKLSEEIFHQLSRTDIWEYSYYMVYHPIADRKEPDISNVVDQLWKLGKKVYLPRIEGENMLAASYDSETILHANKWGILEPPSHITADIENLEVIIMPMVICDQYGNRIGYGKGYYDRFLENISNTALKVGVNFFKPIEEEIPTESTDIKLDYCFTPDSIVSFEDKS